MSQAVFGAGLMWGTQLADALGNPVANPTPILFGTLQDASVEVSFDHKMLYGSDSQYPKFVGRGKGKVSGKAKFGTIKGSIFASLFFGQSSNSGIQAINYDTVGAAIPTTPFQIIVVPPTSGVFQSDLGVIYKSTGMPLTRVAASPVTGQYTVNSGTGTYLFAAADTALVVFINYSYTATSTTAQKQTVISQPMGSAPTFRMDLYLPYAGKNFVLTLNSCIASKLSMSTKLDEYMIPEMDFEGFQDSSGNVMSWSTSE